MTVYWIMKNIYSLLFLALPLIFACKKTTIELRSVCVDQYLETQQLIKYDGQDIGCKFYVTLFELDGKQYFYSDNACADLLSIPEDCDRNPYCASIHAPELTFFFQNAVNKGIVGFKD